MDIEKIEKAIGYSFKNKELLERAFTHKSYNSNPQKNYESLEFLGDSIIELVISEKLFKMDPTLSEGKLTSQRAALVMKPTLASVMEKLGIDDQMLFGQDAINANIISDDKRKCDLFEAITAAIYLDSNNMNKAKKFVLKNLNKEIPNISKLAYSNPANYKSELNKKYPGPQYKVEYKLKEEKMLKDNSHLFVVEIYINGELSATGSGNTIKKAQGEAAKNCLNK